MLAEEGEVFDALVIGAGFGGLGAAMALAEQGARVAVCESLRYPGGCASTFSRFGEDFESGATLMSGLSPNQLFGRWLSRHGVDLSIDWVSPLVELRSPDLTLPIPSERRALVDAFCALPGAPAAGLRGFFAEQERVANVLWKLFDDPSLLPPWTAGTIARLSRGTFDYARLLPLLGKPLVARLRHHGVDGFAPLVTFADALCQITVQCSAAEAEAPFALAAMDYYYRGTGHVRGGVGKLAWALWEILGRLGATMFPATRVRSLSNDASGLWVAKTRQGELRARAVMANLLPSALESLLEPPLVLKEKTRALGRAVANGWGAVMLYAVAQCRQDHREEPHHLDLVANVSRPFIDGNHVFVSIGEPRADAELGRVRSITMSTHVPLQSLENEAVDVADYIATVQSRMRETLALRAPEWSSAIVRSMTASPRTFERFTGRPGGAVGGIPRRAGLHNYRALGPHEALARLWLVGDSVFPGQSALATAVGGVRAAAAAARVL
jgi:phytoene dehydrogenase-like protein